MGGRSHSCGVLPSDLGKGRQDAGWALAPLRVPSLSLRPLD